MQSSEVGYRQNAFKFYHIYGTHLPLRMTRDYEYKELERTRDSLKEVAAGVVGLVRIMFDRLKDLGIFHDSLIFVVADHGMWSSVADASAKPKHFSRPPQSDKSPALAMGL